MKKNDGLYVKVKIGNRFANGLVDTGSTVSILHTLRFQSLSEELKQKLQPTPFTLKMADRCPVPCVGTANLPIQVGNKVYLQDVLVAEIEAPFVLGYDFMYKNNCLIDICQGTLSFKDQAVQCLPESKMPSAFKISLNKTIEIPANSETITYGTFKENEPHFSTEIFEQYD